MTVRILYVCTANQCRSPIAEALTVQRAQHGGLGAASAGLMGGGHPAPDAARRAAETLGVDLVSHRSRSVTREDVDQADLVLTMTREHAREIVAMWPDAWPRVFTLKQFARWEAGESVPRDEGFRDWLVSAASARSLNEVLGDDPVDDIADPLGRPSRVWRRSIGEIRSAVETVVERLDQ